MSYFVTGATGFIGRFLVDKLIAREGPIYVLVRKGSVKKLDQLRARWGAEEKRVIAVVGDLAKPRLGLSPGEIAKLKGKVKHFFHLAAIYDLAADAASQEQANIEGTRHAVQLSDAIGAGVFHHDICWRAWRSAAQGDRRGFRARCLSRHGADRQPQARAHGKIPANRRGEENRPRFVHNASRVAGRCAAARPWQSVKALWLIHG